MRFALVAALSYLACAEAYDVVQLTADNYDELTDGKTVFLKFFAPWVRTNEASPLRLLRFKRQLAPCPEVSRGIHRRLCSWLSALSRRFGVFRCIAHRRPWGSQVSFVGFVAHDRDPLPPWSANRRSWSSQVSFLALWLTVNERSCRIPVLTFHCSTVPSVSLSASYYCLSFFFLHNHLSIFCCCNSSGEFSSFRLVGGRRFGSAVP
jgi:hypothetical protein